MVLYSSHTTPDNSGIVVKKSSSASSHLERHRTFEEIDLSNSFNLGVAPAWSRS